MDGPNPMNPCLPPTQSTYRVYDVPVSTMTSQLCAQNRRFHANWRVSTYQRENWWPMTIFNVTWRQALRNLASRPVTERAATKTIREPPKLARSSSAQSSRKPRRSPGRLIRTITQMFFSHIVFSWKYFTHLHVLFRGSKLSWVIINRLFAAAVYWCGSGLEFLIKRAI